MSEGAELMPPWGPQKRSKLEVFTAVMTVVIAAIAVVIFVFMMMNNGSAANLQTDLNTVTQKVADLDGHLTSVGNLVNNQKIYKYGVTHMTPRTFQEDRGTCWDFATIQVLEASYRQNGYKKGFMAERDYVAFSQQAFGLSMIAACKAAKSGKDIGICDEFGDGVMDGSTEGGEIQWLKYLPDVWNKVLPHSVCPYTDGAHEHECPGMDDALKTNPIKFNITAMHTTYDVEMSRRMLMESGRVLGWSSPTHYVSYYMPCNDLWAARPECQEGKRVPCPTYRNYGTQYCARLETSGYNLDGEFFMHDQYIIEGGHAMNAVGFNDHFVTQSGQVGGFVLMNSWHDAIYPIPRGPRGSHSLPFYLSEISDWDERIICPNARNPRNWLSCIDMQVGPHSRVNGNLPAQMPKGTPRPHNPLVPTANNAEAYDMNLCLANSDVEWIVRLMRQPMEFVCKDASYCSQDPDMRWFFKSATPDVSDTQRYTMVGYNTTSQQTSTVVLPPMPAEFVAEIFTPIDSELTTLANSNDECGFYFFPYDIMKLARGAAFLTDFEITWDNQSYVSNAAQYPSLNYDLVKSSTGNQARTTFDGPTPFAR
ncbi:putative hect e3 ubiquitin [Paratrimastix pyriformis]|uniref:Hect e3 ubiquitin n=1 Tax=Paratrimastix pyriformis TaxID=342808 RepID=A0ABQ8UIW6_9EUKA|nr:putative hect e3 ubiquitin [Paratrimastix pyriformis]